MGYTEHTKPEYIRIAGACIASVATFLWGKPDIWLYSLVAVVALDYITGFIAATIRKELSSRVGLRGILKKMLFFIIVAVAQIVDNATGAGGVVRGMAIGYLVANESLSIVENCAHCGIQFPPKLIGVLKQLRGEEYKPPGDAENTE